MQKYLHFDGFVEDFLLWVPPLNNNRVELGALWRFGLDPVDWAVEVLVARELDPNTLKEGEELVAVWITRRLALQLAINSDFEA